jgi:hypothetical protein
MTLVINAFWLEDQGLAKDPVLEALGGHGALRAISMRHASTRARSHASTAEGAHAR